MKLPIKGSGQVISDDQGILSIHYSNFSESKENKNSFKIEGENITTELVEDSPIEDIPTAFLKLHLISHRHFKPNTLNMDNIFNVIETIAWTNQGPMRPEVAEKLVDGTSSLKIFSLDKFPPMADYIIPSHVRIADTSRVRLGAYLGKGTTIMHEGFVNYNAGTEGPNMIEGRISAGVFVGKDSDLGGGCSTMGTLSGGNKEIISIGERCLLGANSGIGISLGNDCTVEAGLYVTAGTKVTLLDKSGENKLVKAIELSGKDGILYFRDSISGKVYAKPNKGEFKLNKVLHDNN
jgi:2,3,4,5-tetrahydropyridine-2-carboxylate N-succinyltransferase